MLGWPSSPPITAPAGTSPAIKHPPALPAFLFTGPFTLSSVALFFLSFPPHIGTQPVPPANICPDMAFA